jgi:MFS family permease
MTTISVSASMTETEEYSVKKAVPVMLLLFLLCLIIDNSFKIISIDMAKDFNISATTVSWQATLAGLVIGIGAVVYAALADSISIRKLLTIGIILICVGSVMGYLFQHSFLLVGSLLLGGFFVNTSVIVFVLSMIIFSSSFAFMYAPMLESCISTIGKDKSGTAIGFYNLILNVAMSIGIAYTAAMMDHSAMRSTILRFISLPEASMFSNILFVLVLITAFSLFLYWVLVGRKLKMTARDM